MTNTKEQSAAPAKIEIYDTTLRDGTQAEGVAFSLEDKLLVAAKLDELGVDYIEGGYPLSNDKDEAFFQKVRSLKLKNSRIAAFGMTRKKDVAPADDIGLNALKKCRASVLAVVAKAWDMQVKTVLRASLDENLKMVEDSIRFLKGRTREVFFDAEHFFDGYLENPQYALKVLQVAAEAGASRLVLCDTNGGMLFGQIGKIVAEVVGQLDVPVGIHCHNDTGLAVANSLAAVEAGAMQVQGTINGFGERSGNADLCAIIPNLALKMKRVCLSSENLKRLTETSRYVYDMANLNLPLNQPYVGVSSFSHKGGMHVHAVQRSSRCYEHVEPETVGNCRRVIISELSGTSNLLAKSEKLALVQDNTVVRKILKQVQELENEGYQFETAEASFDLIVRKFLGNYHTFFEMDHYRMVISRSSGRLPVSEAIVKILINGKVEHRVAEGDGPVNAMDGALRRALAPYYPGINDMQLVDYRVRVVNPRAATAAKVRVLIESRDANHRWGTIGVSENIIDASWKALVDSIEYKLLRDEEQNK